VEIASWEEPDAPEADDLPSLPGIYILRISNQEGVETLKLMLE